MKALINFLQSIMYISLCLGLCFILTGEADASFPDVGLGARPMGMGGAFVALADDANAVFWNPAGLSSLQKYEFSSMYLSLYGLDVSTQLLCATYRHPFRGGVGIGILRTGESDLYTEDSVIVAAGQNLYPFIKTNLSVGVNLKLLHKGYQGIDIADDPLFEEGTSVSQLSCDAGILWHTRYKFIPLSIGGTIENLFPVDTSLSDEDSNNATSVFRIGFAVQPRPQIKVIAEGVQRQLVAPFAQQSGRLGAEWTPLGSPLNSGSALMIRAGLRVAQTVESWESTAYLGSGLQLGIGHSPAARIDYAFSIPVLTAFGETPGNTHRFSFSLAFELVREKRPISDLAIREADTHYEKGLKAFNSKDYYPAAKEFNIVLSLIPEHADATDRLVAIKGLQFKIYNDDATEALIEGNYEKAIQLWKRALEMNPGNLEICKQIEDAYKRLIEREGTPKEESDKIMNQLTALRIFGDGLAKFISGDLVDANRQMNLAIQADREFALAYLYFGISQFKQGDLIAAEAQFKQAMQIDKDISLPPDIGAPVWKAFFEAKGEPFPSVSE